MIAVQKKFIILSSAVLVAFALSFWAVTGSFLNQIKLAGAKYSANQETLARLDQQESLFKDLKKSYQEKTKNLLLIKNAFLKKEEVATFIANLEDLARQTGNSLEIKLVESSAPKPDSPEKYPYLSVQTVIKGDFRGLLLFLASLEDSPYSPYRLLEIANIEIRSSGPDNSGTKAAGKQESAKLQANLSLKIYTQ